VVAKRVVRSLRKGPSSGGVRGAEEEEVERSGPEREDSERRHVESS